jgi:phytoene synthase
VAERSSLNPKRDRNGRASPGHYDLRQSDPDRYFAALLAPEPMRHDLLTLYAFNAEIAKVGETVREPMLGEIRFAWWQETLDQIEPQSLESRGPVRDLAAVVNRHALPRDLLAGMIEARQTQDLGLAPIATWSGFEDYADRTAGALFRIAAHVMGAATVADEASVAGGRAWALTGHLRSFAVNLERHKLFLPAELFSKHGLDTNGIFHAEDAATLLAPVQEAVSRAQGYLAEFRNAWRHATKPALPAFGYLALTETYLKRMTGPSYNPTSPAPNISSQHRIAKLLLTSLIKRI